MVRAARKEWQCGVDRKSLPLPGRPSWISSPGRLRRALWRSETMKPIPAAARCLSVSSSALEVAAVKGREPGARQAPGPGKARWRKRSSRFPGATLTRAFDRGRRGKGRQAPHPSPGAAPPLGREAALGREEGGGRPLFCREAEGRCRSPEVGLALEPQHHRKRSVGVSPLDVRRTECCSLRQGEK